MRCSFCNEPVIQATLEGHHRTKRSRGGQDFAENMAGVCPRCHSLTHFAEGLFKRGMSEEDVSAMLNHYLLQLEGIDFEKALENLLKAGKRAATTVGVEGRKFVPVEVKFPPPLLEDATRLASDCNVSRNSLILWAVKELVEGRAVLPKG